MTARTKVTLVEASEIKDYLARVVRSEFDNGDIASRIIDALFAQGVIDVDAALAPNPSPPRPAATHPLGAPGFFPACSQEPEPGASSFSEEGSMYAQKWSEEVKVLSSIVGTSGWTFTRGEAAYWMERLTVALKADETKAKR